MTEFVKVFKNSFFVVLIALLDYIFFWLLRFPIKWAFNGRYHNWSSPSADPKLTRDFSQLVPSGIYKWLLQSDNPSMMVATVFSFFFILSVILVFEMPIVISKIKLQRKAAIHSIYGNKIIMVMSVVEGIVSIGIFTLLEKKLTGEFWGIILSVLGCLAAVAVFVVINLNNANMAFLCPKLAIGLNIIGFVLLGIIFSYILMELMLVMIGVVIVVVFILRGDFISFVNCLFVGEAMEDEAFCRAFLYGWFLGNM
ncbi:MAG: hypothetical protein J6K48_06510 [Lachnospiraceae bacterium]|nr:hypothetical protein [Lachnospiraceae bacterium]